MVGESTLQLENNTVNGNSWLWTFGTGDTSNIFEPRITYKMPGDYLIDLISFGPTGCPDTTHKEIRVRNKEYIYVPNAFTPNGDQVNDCFFMLTTHIQSANISIFNRWGQFIYSSDDKDFRWDGTSNGNQAELGVYGYVINATGEGGRTYTQFGTVTLVR